MYAIRSYYAKDIGLNIPDSTRLLLCEVGIDHPLVWTEQLMPVMPLVRVKDVDTAIELAVEVEHGFRHTAIMHVITSYSIHYTKLYDQGNEAITKGLL